MKNSFKAVWLLLSFTFALTVPFTDEVDPHGPPPVVIPPV